METRSWTRSVRAFRLPAAILLSLVVAFLVAPLAAVLLAVGWFLYLAARYDNHTGSCFMLAVLVVLAVAILATLVAFLGLFARS